MRESARFMTTASTVAAIPGALDLQLRLAADASIVDEWKKAAFDRKKGKRLACRQIEGGSLPGDMGPPLVGMKARFPEKAKLRAQIRDFTGNNPNSMKPPFGRHEILTGAELDIVVEFVYSL